MRSRYVLHEAHRYVEQVIEGEVTLEGLNELIERVVRDPAWDPEFNGLVDLREAHVNLSVGAVSELARRLKNDHRTGRGACAIVVSGTLAHGVVKMFEALSDDLFVVQIFRDRGAAEAWLESAAIPIPR